MAGYLKRLYQKYFPPSKPVNETAHEDLPLEARAVIEAGWAVKDAFNKLNWREKRIFTKQIKKFYDKEEKIERARIEEMISKY